MRLRDANVQDAPAIADLWNPIIRDTLNTFTTEEKTIIALETAISAAGLENRGYFIAEDAVGLLGFCTYFQFRGGPGYRHTMEHSIILAPRAMRQGIGRQLMERLCRHASNNGVHSLWAGVSAANFTGLKFHKALGFQERARLPEVGYKFETWLDLILMQKIL